MVVNLFIGFLLFLLGLWSWIRFSRKNAIAFLHPYCETGGGGEVVLWKSINALREVIRERQETCKIYIYTTVMDNDTLGKAKKSINERFGFELNAEDNVNVVQFIHIRSRTLLEPKWYPRFTLFGQFLGGVIVSFECLFRLNPTLLIESTGIPGAYPVFNLIGGSKVLVYMHYPTITTNMIQRVNRREKMYNNAEFIARNPLLSSLKCYYYMAFACIYRLCGRFAAKVLVNGTFTKQHIEELWPSVDIKLCYPPVALDKFFDLESIAESVFEETKEVAILSLGQFRPEKNHVCQLETLNLLKQSGDLKFCLYMLGGVRNEDDEKVVSNLRKVAAVLNLEEDVDFKFVLNAPMDKLSDLLSKSMFGIHTMIDEHFGIALVEMMASGVIVVAHKSGGPFFDIIGDKRDVGFLGAEAKDYADTILDAMSQTKEQRQLIRLAASKKAKEFSEQGFKSAISSEIISLFSGI